MSMKSKKRKLEEITILIDNLIDESKLEGSQFNIKPSGILIGTMEKRKEVRGLLIEKISKYI